MTWEGRILEPLPSGSVVDEIDNLFAVQMASWPELKTGVDGLRRARSREFQVQGFRVVARHIPHRIESTTARVDPDAIRGRPCFLCPDNLPDAEQGFGFGPDWVFACNPFPILRKHVSIIGRDHMPQRIDGAFRTMLDLAAVLPEYMVVYNGPECGASAPDHIHFQACLHEGVPVVGDLERASDGVIPGYLRSVFVLKDADVSRLDNRFQDLFTRLHALDPDRSEPMINLVALYRGGEWTVALFPRVKHRPDAFYTGGLTWSPASIDLCGIIVLPVGSNLEKITAIDIEQVFQEVSLDPDVVEGIARELGAA